ncbi:WYL domain-containing protein [Vibrio cortegadensis]
MANYQSYRAYNNERSLALHRIEKASVSTFTFDRLQDFKLIQYDADGRFGFGVGENCRLEFCITREAGFHLTETPLSHDQNIQNRNDHYHISATVVQSMQLDRWLKSFNKNIWNIKM